MNLRNKLSIVLIIAGVLMVASCGQKKNEKKYYTIADAETEFLASLTAEDTTKVLELANSFMQLTKERNVDSAINMLYTINLQRAIAHKLSGEQKASIKKSFDTFPVFEYNIKYYSFSTQANNDISFEIEFTPRPDSETKGASMGFMLNPIRDENGDWYLAIKDGKLPSKETMKQIHPKAPAPFYIKVLK